MSRTEVEAKKKVTVLGGMTDPDCQGLLLSNGGLEDFVWNFGFSGTCLRTSMFNCKGSRNTSATQQSRIVEDSYDSGTQFWLTLPGKKTPTN